MEFDVNSPEGHAAIEFGMKNSPMGPVQIIGKRIHLSPNYVVALDEENCFGIYKIQ